MKNTLRELFHISIRAENEARLLYSGLATRFSALPKAYDFFNSLAADESAHIEFLHKLQGSLPPEELDKPAPGHALALAEGFMNYSAKSINDEIRTLGDAYRKTVNFEFSEVNKLHELLGALILKDSDDILRHHESLKEHQDRISAFRLSGAEMDYKA
jgi:rubrerythrin